MGEISQLTLRVDPVRIEIRQCGLVAGMFDGLGRLLVDETAGATPTALLLGIGRQSLWPVHFGSKGDGARDQQGGFGGVRRQLDWRWWSKWVTGEKERGDEVTPWSRADRGSRGSRGQSCFSLRSKAGAFRVAGNSPKGGEL